MTHVQHIPASAFPAFLKTWRTRRRLSQLDLSLEAGMSQRHISFLETGRSRPSRFAISQLGEALEMPAAEVDAMLLAAGFAARSQRSGQSEKTRAAINASIDHILKSHAPYPAVSVDRIWTLQKANEPAQKFFAAVGAPAVPNLLHAIMMPGALRAAIVNWQATAQALFRLLELETTRRPHDEEAHQLLATLRDLEGVAEAISQPNPQDPEPVLTIQFQAGEQVLSLFSLIATIGMSTDATLDDLRIETLLPADDSTRDWFAYRF